MHEETVQSKQKYDYNNFNITRLQLFNVQQMSSSHHHCNYSYLIVTNFKGISYIYDIFTK